MPSIPCSKDSEQIFASKYRLVLPSEDELEAEVEREKRLVLRELAEEYRAYTYPDKFFPIPPVTVIARAFFPKQSPL